jgi:hypothetical protein
MTAAELEHNKNPETDLQLTLIPPEGQSAEETSQIAESERPEVSPELPASTLDMLWVIDQAIHAGVIGSGQIAWVANKVANELGLPFIEFSVAPIVDVRGKWTSDVVADLEAAPPEVLEILVYRLDLRKRVD